MGKHVITVNSSADWKTVETELNNYAAGLKTKLQEIIDRTATVGAMRAGVEKGSGENSNVAVSIVRVKGGKAVRESGPDVYFNEFGAGVYTDTGSPYAALVPVSVQPGSWSSSPAGKHEFEKYGSWHHNKIKYIGIFPTKAMQKAGNNMKQELPRIVADVFK